MATEFQTSFIPKQSGNVYSTSPERRGGGVNFLSLATLVIFLGTVAFAGGVFVYKVFVKRDIASLEGQLAQAREDYEPNFIAEATRLNTRIETAKGLLKKHVAVSEVFRLLEQSTIQNVSFDSFNFSTDSDGLTMRINAEGVARDYSSIVAQSDEYGRTTYVRDLLFSGLNINNAGLVQFSLDAKVDPQLVSFERTVDSRPSVTDAPAATTQNPSQQVVVPVVSQPRVSTSTPPATIPGGAPNTSNQ
jgi:hypothetical protein